MILLRSINHVLDESDMMIYPAELDGSPVISMGKEWRDLEDKHWEIISGKDQALIYYYDDLLDLEIDYNIKRRKLKTKWRIQ